METSRILGEKNTFLKTKTKTSVAYTETGTPLMTSLWLEVRAYKRVRWPRNNIVFHLLQISVKRTNFSNQFSLKIGAVQIKSFPLMMINAINVVIFPQVLPVAIKVYISTEKCSYDQWEPCQRCPLSGAGKYWNRGVDYWVFIIMWLIIHELPLRKRFNSKLRWKQVWKPLTGSIAKNWSLMLLENIAVLWCSSPTLVCFRTFWKYVWVSLHSTKSHWWLI